LSWLSFQVILVLPILFIAYWALWYQQGMVAIFPPGSLAPAHEALDCKQCHVESWRGWHRLLGTDRTAAAMDRACAQCHGGLPDDHSGNPLLEVRLGSVVPPQVVAAHDARQIPSEVGSCADCHHEHEPGKRLLAVTEDQCLRCHSDLRTVDRRHTFYPNLASFDTDHPPFGWWRGGLQDTGALHFNHQIHLRLEEKGMHGMDGALPRLKKLACGSCHQPDSRGRHMAPVRYDRHCAECRPLAVRMLADTKDATVREAVEAFCRQPAPHSEPDLVSAVLRQRLRLLAEQNPMVWNIDRAPQLLRPIPGRRLEPSLPRDLSSWVDDQTSVLRRLLFESPGGCRYCHVAKKGADGLALAEYELTNVPVSWFPYAKFSHAKHGLMECNECHDKAGTSTRTGDVLLPSKQKCVECHGSQGGLRGRARADCLECHQYHGSGRGDSGLISARRRE
jgi:hypothetical protein